VKSTTPEVDASRQWNGYQLVVVYRTSLIRRRACSATDLDAEQAILVVDMFCRELMSKRPRDQNMDGHRSHQVRARSIRHKGQPDHRTLMRPEPIAVGRPRGKAAVGPISRRPPQCSDEPSVSHDHLMHQMDMGRYATWKRGKLYDQRPIRRFVDELDTVVKGCSHP